MWMMLRRIFSAGAKSFIRSGSVSFATVLIMTVTLAIIGFLVFLSAVLSTTLSGIRDKVDVNVYFLTTASESDIMNLRTELEELPEVASATYTSAEQALAEFRERHADDELTLRALDELGENPLGASLSVKATDPSQYEGIVNYLEEGGPMIIDRVNYFQNKTVIERLTSAINATARAGSVIVFLFALASTIIALATIRLAIYSSRDEIAVMRLVGASNMYIRGPFIVAGTLSGVFAALITLLLFYPAAWYVGKATAVWLGGFNVFTYYVDNFPMFFLVLVGAGVFLGGFASFLGVRRYLKI
ncbi:MAG TPA: permease-like cell division protein FtsX [Candidatus Paceibacterota bacterium]|nr:permease-like cell division protein FtsX [Candidatus Paceibacterota bacterium]